MSFVTSIIRLTNSVKYEDGKNNVMIIFVCFDFLVVTYNHASLALNANISMQKTLKRLTSSFFPHQGSSGVFLIRVLLP
jgi:hypothetical protein